jgi:hypothetical protein
VQKAIDKEITQAEAAHVIGRSLRQVQRIVHRVKQEGDLGICHRARGKGPNNRIRNKIKTRFLISEEEPIYELDPTHASEKLLETIVSI